MSELDADLADQQLATAILALSLCTWVSEVHRDLDSLGAVNFTRGVLRTQTLQRLAVYAHWLAGSVAQAPGGADGPRGGRNEEGSAGAEPAQLHRLQAAPALLLERMTGLERASYLFRHLVLNVCDVAADATQAASQPGTASRGQDRERLRLQVARRVLIAELVDAVATSNLLEHLARALLAAAARIGAAADKDPPDATECDWGLALADVFDASKALRYLLENVPERYLGGAAAAAKLRSALTGPGMQHLALTAGLAALHAGDGGPCHGLPEHLVRGMPVLLQDEDDDEPTAQCVRHLPKAGAVMQGPEALSAMVNAISWPLAEECPLGRRASALLLLRVCRFAVDSAEGWGATSVPGQPRILLGVDAASLACDALAGLDKILREQSKHASARAGSWATEAEAERWRAAVAACQDSTLWLDDEYRLLAQAVFGLLDGGHLLSPDGTLPAQPSSAVAAALDAGLLPCLERHLRLGAKYRYPPAAQMASELLSALAPTASAARPGLQHLLAYGPVDQAAAFVATVAKLLRRMGQDGAAERPDPTRTEAETEAERRCARLIGAIGQLHDPLLPLLRDAAVSAPAQSPPAPHQAAAGAATEPHAGAERGSHPARQLVLVLAASAVQWLPELSRLAVSHLEADVAARRQQGTAAGFSVWSERTRGVLAMPLAWLKVLTLLGEEGGSGGLGAGESSADAGGMPHAGPSTTVPAAGGGGGGEAGGCSTWRRFLAAESGALPLLGLMLRLSESWSPPPPQKRAETFSNSYMLMLPALCAAVAAAAPEELRRASRDGAAAAGSSSGGSSAATTSTGASPAYWNPALLRGLAIKLVVQGCHTGAMLATELASVVTEWGSGGEVDRRRLALLGERDRPFMVAKSSPNGLAVVSQGLPRMEEVRALLPACGFPRCSALQGDSEAGVVVAAYAEGLGGCKYCGAECARRHREAGAAP
ncbi:hypothetical protein HYH03_005556 [Edaphochlamys debaryana]|uniref:Uncharacterized protein n=1 Tax=Edaphochlamys debaryana TaxID=47281 RepID=A0A835YEV5_9CHLO|nr:hypothetical protein HYH03_005556 [Edaphochlamys debaryana]|eukprot:KAG2496324.1 hypothetical protein HYH03_005556 [Edaphochlamys debaryana]